MLTQQRSAATARAMAAEANRQPRIGTLPRKWMLDLIEVAALLELRELGHFVDGRYFAHRHTPLLRLVEDLFAAAGAGPLVEQGHQFLGSLVACLARREPLQLDPGQLQEQLDLGVG